MALLWQKDAPIVRRIDENDVYKILMLYFIWSYYPNLRVQFGFKNRTRRIPIAHYVRVEEFQEQLDAYATLRFTPEITAIYRSWGMFSEDFLAWLPTLRLTAPTVRREGDDLIIEVEGLWSDVTLWEIPTLCIASELYGRGFAAENGIAEQALYDEGNRRLAEKIVLFNQYPTLRLAQFGLRRRFSGPWEDHMTGRLIAETTPGIVTGVSNMYLAAQHGVEAVGTNAHELPMALTALARHVSEDVMRDAPYLVLQQWQQLLGQKALIMLDDAYGSERFRRGLPVQLLKSFKGFRHDSGDPFAYGEAVIAHYQVHGLDPARRLIIFSDGLTPQKTVDLLQHFTGRIGTAFGMGTNLTNDLGLVTPLSLVMKIMYAAGNPAVKLSNNVNKATGPDLAEIEYYKRVFGYENTEGEAVVY